MAPRALLDLLVPPLCALCASEAATEAALCAGCERRLARPSPVHPAVAGADVAWAARPYEGAARELVAALKFGRRLGLAEHAAALIAAEAPVGLLAGRLVPVPAAPMRRALRGFDPAEAIARPLARRLGLALEPCLARRGGPRQVGRSRAARLGDPPRVRAAGAAPPCAILVDDVTTTGATLSACAVALRSAGAGEVVAVAFAAAPLGWALGSRTGAA